MLSAGSGRKVSRYSIASGLPEIFSVDGDDSRDKKRFAGLVYKLFGFSIGDRYLPVRTLWGQSFPRALWFTGEIHIVDKDVVPTTDRSDFVETDSRKRLYKAAERIPAKLNKLAQEISNNRKAYEDGDKFKQKLETWRERLRSGKLEKAELKSIRGELHESLSRLRQRAAKCTDLDVQHFDKEVQKYAANLQKELDEAKSPNSDTSIADVAADLHMTSKAQKVFQIVMDVLADHYADDPDAYYEVSAKITKALRKKY